MVHELERTALAWINGIAVLANSPLHTDQFATATGMALGQADIRMVEFLSGQGPVPISRIADALAIDLAQASRQVARLVTGGRVLRSPDPDDGRRTLVTLTPATAAGLDAWLMLWSSVHRDALSGWVAEDVAELAECLTLLVSCLHRALPDQPVLSIDDRWDALVGRDLPPAERAAGRAIVAGVTWIGQSQGFDDLLAYLGSPIRQPAFLALRSLVAHGPMTVSEVAREQGVDRSLASRRLTFLAEWQYVTHTPAPDDRRRRVVAPTDAGAEFVRLVADTQLQLFHSTLPGLTAARRRRWTVLMQRYVAALDFLDRSR
ncbi:MAG: MarR family transcriptional regulator [Propionibacterium sp.]|nr:MarR family transcriptional regulator [Propionibacterium sp.]